MAANTCGKRIAFALHVLQLDCRVTAVRCTTVRVTCTLHYQAKPRLYHSRRKPLTLPLTLAPRHAHETIICILFWPPTRAAYSYSERLLACPPFSQSTPHAKCCLPWAANALNREDLKRQTSSLVIHCRHCAHDHGTSRVTSATKRILYRRVVLCVFVCVSSVLSFVVVSTGAEA